MQKEKILESSELILKNLKLGNSFAEKVYAKLILVPSGFVTTYKDLAKAIGSHAYRAVGSALNKNPHAPTVPCHRVVNSDGGVGKFAFGVNKKVELLLGEGVGIVDGKVVGFEAKRWKF